MIFFDIDGTLLDHEQAEQAAVHAFFESHAVDLGLSAAAFAKGWQRASSKYYQRYLRGAISFPEQRRARLREVFSPYQALTDHEADQLFDDYLQQYEKNWTLFPEVLDVLQDLSRSRLGIISNGDAQQQRRKLASMGIESIFSMILISGDFGISKPEPGIFLLACEQAELPPGQCWYVGNHYQDDALAAHKAGLRGIWVTPGH